MEPVQFSVVIPTRLRDHSLARCLEALMPGIQNVVAEIIVTDDASVDSTQRMIASRFPGVRWTAGPRRGPAANRNHGASLATGELIVFVDDDVVPSPGLLGGYAQAVTAGVHVYEGRTTCRVGLQSPLEVAPINESGGYLWSCNMMVRRSFWQRFGGFDEEFPYPHMEDVAFRERLKSDGERFVFVPMAAVDHPPRRLPPASARLRVHESYFLYSYKYLGRPPSMRVFLEEHMRYYMRPIAKRAKSRDSFVAFGSMCLELYGIVKRWRKWDEKYRDRAPSTSPQR